MYKVLLIEEDEANRKYLAEIVEKERFEIILADKGLSGIELFKSENPQIVLTALELSDIDGMELAHTIKGLSPETELIVFTGFGDLDTAIAAIREGVLDYLKKPVDPEILCASLVRAKEKLQLREKEQFIPHILLAEDEDIPRSWLKYGLERENENWKILEASNGEAAITIFNLVKVDIVLLDIKMPKMDGLEALRQMRGISDDFEAIILTGHGDEQSAMQAVRDGAMSFLKKPVDLDQLIVLIEKALEKLQNERELKYRTRELKLAKEVIAQNTLDGEVLMNTRNTLVEQALSLSKIL